MSIQEFVCYPCGAHWHDKYSFWSGYQSLCPWCGESRPAVRDIREYTDRREIEYAGFDIAGPLFEFEENVAEGDLEAEPDQIHDEMAAVSESLGTATSDPDVDVEGAGADADNAGDSTGGDL